MMYHMLGHKINLIKFNKIEIICVFFNHSGIKLEICNKRKMRKLTNIWKLSKELFNNIAKKKYKGKLENILGKIKMKHNVPHASNAVKTVLKRGFYGDKCPNFKKKKNLK